METGVTSTLASATNIAQTGASSGQDGLNGQSFRTGEATPGGVGTSLVKKAGTGAKGAFNAAKGYVANPGDITVDQLSGGLKTGVSIVNDPTGAAIGYGATLASNTNIPGTGALGQYKQSIGDGKSFYNAYNDVSKLIDDPEKAIKDYGKNKLKNLGADALGSLGLDGFGLGSLGGLFGGGGGGGKASVVALSTMDNYLANNYGQTSNVTQVNEGLPVSRRTKQDMLPDNTRNATDTGRGAAITPPSYTTQPAGRSDDYSGPNTTGNTEAITFPVTSSQQAPYTCNVMAEVYQKVGCFNMQISDFISLEQFAKLSEKGDLRHAQVPFAPCQSPQMWQQSNVALSTHGASMVPGKAWQHDVFEDPAKLFKQESCAASSTYKTGVLLPGSTADKPKQETLCFVPGCVYEWNESGEAGECVQSTS